MARRLAVKARAHVVVQPHRARHLGEGALDGGDQFGVAHRPEESSRARILARLRRLHREVEDELTAPRADARGDLPRPRLERQHGVGDRHSEGGDRIQVLEPTAEVVDHQRDPPGRRRRSCRVRRTRADPTRSPGGGTTRGVLRRPVGAGTGERPPYPLRSRPGGYLPSPTARRRPFPPGLVPPACHAQPSAKPSARPRAIAAGIQPLACRRGRRERRVAMRGRASPEAGGHLPEAGGREARLRRPSSPARTPRRAGVRPPS